MITTTLPTPDGPFCVLWDDGAVLAAGWTADTQIVIDRVRVAERPHTAEPVSADDSRLSAVREAVEAYYSGEVHAIDTVPVRQFGTPLQQHGWTVLRRIPAGRPLSYSEFAQQLGSPSAVRAAASICARNAPALFVPCHRVLRSDGSLGGFAWGLEVKRSLLAREAAATGL